MKFRSHYVFHDKRPVDSTDVKKFARKIFCTKKISDSVLSYHAILCHDSIWFVQTVYPKAVGVFDGQDEMLIRRRDGRIIAIAMTYGMSEKGLRSCGCK